MMLYVMVMVMVVVVAKETCLEYIGAVFQKPRHIQTDQLAQVSPSDFV